MTLERKDFPFTLLLHDLRRRHQNSLLRNTIIIVQFDAIIPLLLVHSARLQVASTLKRVLERPTMLDRLGEVYAVPESEDTDVLDGHKICKQDLFL